MRCIDAVDSKSSSKTGTGVLNGFGSGATRLRPV
jgi:hypothetical protein